MSLRSAFLASFLGTAAPFADLVPAPLLDAPSIQDSDQLALDLLVRQTRDLLLGQGIVADVQARVKTPKSVHQKMRRKGVGVEQIYDRLALRVIVEDEATCYEVRRLVESQHAVLLGERDDYIAAPKANGYQSLHTVVRGVDGTTAEVQIRTRAMHAHAEHGGASHAEYKRRTVVV